MSKTKSRRRNPQIPDSKNDLIDWLTRATCAVLCVALISSGVIFLINRDHVSGGMLISSGIVLAVLALKFRRFKFKAGLFEIEAQRN
jgi:hypothetical protein